MHPLVLSLAIHNHQPVGNFDHVIAKATDSAYAPFVGALERHPRIRLALHYSGPLLDWLKPHRPDLLQRIRMLVARGQIEILTGGYYEPILAVIPDADKRGQIEMLTRVVAAEFGCHAEGLWLAERVWEPHLARPIAEAGARYTIVDDTHFYAVGLEEGQLLGYYLTDEAGVPLAIFPSLKRLRYLIPWAPVEDVIGYLRTLAEREVRPDGRRAVLDLALMGDDGEKFGLWPGTHAHCWEHGWIDRFFEALERTPWIEVVPPGEYRRTREPAGRIYLPTASYDEMGEWALPPARSTDLAHLRHGLETSQWAGGLPFVRGGFWRHFLVKYDEINTLYRLSLRAGAKVHAMPPGPEKTRALEALWAGECNCTYWHGVFGGVYLPHIRGAAFSHLIAAEALAEAATHPRRFALAETADLDGDGRPDVRLATELLALTVDPSRGGSVVEWDSKPARRHLGNVLTRRREGYHAGLLEALASGAVQIAGQADLETIHTTAVRVKEPGLERFLIYDRQRRASLRFHLLPRDTTLEQMWHDRQEDLGGFAADAYAWELEEAPGRIAVRLRRLAELGGAQVSAERTIEVASGAHGLVPRTRLRSPGTAMAPTLLAEEWGLGLFGAPGEVWAEAGGRRIPLHEPGALPASERVAVGETHSGLVLTFELSHPATVWAFPLVTISNSESGYEQNFQGAVLVLCRPVELASGRGVDQATRCAITGVPA
ncbi:MAG TPA: alpha-amylase/4-alpha-glucanotransferase domain-containing protein [bacterium]|nr:alpha-amylase/4-alpha-glucanotransferase domain-containing protein [bacterium]